MKKLEKRQNAGRILRRKTALLNLEQTLVEFKKSKSAEKVTRKGNLRSSADEIARMEKEISVLKSRI